MSPVIFNSYLAEDRDTLKVNEVILFTDDVNEGAAYNSKTGIFEAPATGWYRFSFTVGTACVDTNAAVALEINSNVVAYAITDTAQSPCAISQGTNQASVFMRQHETAKVVVYHHDAKSLTGGRYSTFSGYLLPSK